MRREGTPVWMGTGEEDGRNPDSGGDLCRGGCGGHGQRLEQAYQHGKRIRMGSASGYPQGNEKPAPDQNGPERENGQRVLAGTSLSRFRRDILAGRRLRITKKITIRITSSRIRIGTKKLGDIPEKLFQRGAWSGREAFHRGAKAGQHGCRLGAGRSLGGYE